MSRMHAICWNGQAYPDGLNWCEVDRPDPPPGWVLIRNCAAGICGSDLHYLSGAMVHQVPPKNFPAVLGHENAGEIVALGPDVQGWTVGQRVAAEPLHPCRTFGPGLCSACMAGHYHRCSHLSFVGIPANRPLSGGYGEYSLYHTSCLFPLPDAVDFEEAALLDVLACGVHAANVGCPSPRDAVAVLGCGAIGLSALQALRAIGLSDIVAVAKHPFQAELARSLGARTTFCLADRLAAAEELRRLTGTLDQVYECVGGTADTVQQGIELCRPGGKVIVMGFFTGVRPIDLEAVFLKELSILAADAYSLHAEKREFDVALGLLAERRADLKALISHRFPRAAWRQALDAAFDRATSRGLKVMFTD